MILASAITHLVEVQRTGLRSIDSITFSRSITRPEKVISNLLNSFLLTGVVIFTELKMLPSGVLLEAVPILIDSWTISL